MSLKLVYSCLSHSASVDQQTGYLSIFEVVEEIRVPQMPAQVPSLVISLALEKEIPGPFSGKVFIHILTPDGKQQQIGNGELGVPQEQRRVKAVFRFGSFPLLNFGPHRFVISWMNEQNEKQGEALLDFEVVRITQVAQGVAPGQKPNVTH